MQLDSEIRPVRIDGTIETPIRWLYKNHFIELVWLSDKFAVQCREVGKGYKPIQYVKACWPISDYYNPDTTAMHVNKLLPALCVAIDSDEFAVCREASYTRDDRVLDFLHLVKEVRLPIKVLSAELSVLKVEAKEYA